MQEVFVPDASHLDDIIQRLLVLQKELDSCHSIEATLAIYEEMFSLIHQGETHLSRVEQHSFQLQLNSDGSIVKDASGNPIKHPFIPGEPA
ncbi:hypothetical protein FTM89_03235 [Chlamydia trachomatis]|uniref:Uncharacterized protein n=2 Tax=Chlamydia muridarum TaxID=83560 RepID=A0A069ZS86_CHLMR|nr:hypothetical protein [Chlamydia muridarum]UFT43083.1 hypothetical protein FTN46_03235 [Chlamydia trachomatis]AAF39438.1 conserved hypothetical protein [Chlamydia muridarum str. Nigg]AHH22994.1 hypothetical protein TAC_03200 [Chlamydia muridarum str. Nigg3 CMUT3-5]AHH23919.1 hypothetical protein Y015_03200 [Chlamydia muridarum str. Nigg CM972]AID38126.1 hypothetical protein BB17_03250 [Chlamydia muridarum str. Nigg 2 MCR]